MRCKERFNHALVFLAQQAAGGIDQPAARLHQPRRRRQDGLLLDAQFVNRLGRLAPLDVRVAPQSAQAAARRIDQDAIQLAGQAFDLGVVLVRDPGRMDIGQATARQPWPQFGQPFFRHVKGIQAAGVAHQRPERQCLPAGTGTKVGHHLAALRADDVRQQLTTLVLHFNRPAFEQWQILQRRFLVHPQAERRVQGWLADDRRLFQRRHHLFAGGLERVDAQVQRRGSVQRVGQAQGFFLAVLRHQFLVQPGRQFGLHCRRQQGAIDLQYAAQPLTLAVGHSRQRFDAGGFGQPEQSQPPHHRVAAAGGKLSVKTAMTQDGIDRLGDQATFAPAQLGVRAEIM